MYRIKLIGVALVAAVTLMSSWALVHLPSVVASPSADVIKSDAVRQVFLDNYNNYVRFAFGNDSLNLRTLQGYNDSATAGFGGTIIDSLSTMVVMGLTDTPQYRDALAFVKKQSFETTQTAIVDGHPGTVKTFELTIRLIGGMLSAYELNGKKPEERFLVDKAQELADRLQGSWVGSDKIPVSVWNINTQKPYNLQDDTNFAEAGTLTIEWDTLTNFTGQQRYSNLAVGAVDALRTVPGENGYLPPVSLYPTNLTSSTQYVTLGGGFDSYLEYLIKFPTLLGQRDHRFVDTYIKAVETLQQKMVVKAGTEGDLLFTSDYDGKRDTDVFISSHLACFLGGNVAMAGRLLSRDDFTTTGLQLAESCAYTYNATALGLGPYFWGYTDQLGQYAGWREVSTPQRRFTKKHGIFVSVGYWFEAPEVVESLFYAYRITGQQMWQDWAWNIFRQIVDVAGTYHGIAGIQDVNDDSSPIIDEQQSFLYAETLLYLFLIFDDPERYSLDRYVFNTEGHAFLRRQAGTFGPVQGDFPYESLRRNGQRHVKGNSDSTQATPEIDERTPSEQGQGPSTDGLHRMQMAHQLASNTGMPLAVAQRQLLVQQ